MSENSQNSEKKTYKIFEANNQIKITIPKVLANAVGLRKGDEIEFRIERGEIVIHKT